MEKKRILVFLLIFFIVLNFPLNSSQIINITQNITEKSENITGIWKKTDASFSEEISIPGENLIKTLLGIKPEQKLTLKILILVLCFFVGMLIFLQNILIITPFFEGGKSWIGAVIIILLIAITGAIYETTLFFINLLNFSETLKKGNVLGITIIILIIFAFLYGTKILSNTIRKQFQIGEAENTGIKAGSALKKLKIYDEINKFK